MNHWYTEPGGGYPPDLTSDESAGDRDGIYQLDQEEYEDRQPITRDNVDVYGRVYQANSAAYEIDRRNDQGYLENQAHQHSPPVAGQEDQQMDRYNRTPQFLSNYDPQPELSFSNAAVLDNARQQGAYYIDQSIHFHHPHEVMPTFYSDSGGGALDNLWSYNEQRHDVVLPSMPSPGLHGYYTQQSHQHDSPEIKPNCDPIEDFGSNIDPNLDVPGLDFRAYLVLGEQAEHEEGDPWSSENKHHEQIRPPAAQVSQLNGIVGASETSHASQDSDCISNLVSSDTGSTGDAGDLAWGEASVATIRPTCNTPGSFLGHTRYASNLLEDDGQGQRQSSFMPSTNLAFGQQRFPGQSLPDRTALRRSSGQTSNHSSNNLQVPIPESPSSRPSSPSSSTASDVLHCPYCSARFKGTYRQGNYGRHRRQKHLGQPVLLACESIGCDKTFQRTDARGKHYQRHHPELRQDCH